MRALVKPRARSAASSFLNSPLRPRTIGASTLMRSSCGYSITMSMIRSSDCDAISRPQQVAVRHADVGEQQAQVVVDLGDGADRRARVRAGRLLLDGDRRRQAVDQIDVRLLHLLEELPRVRRQRLDVAALPFGVDRVEGERGLARARQAGDDDQLVAREVDVDVLEVVDAGAADRNPVVRHVLLSGTSEEMPKRLFYHAAGSVADVSAASDRDGRLTLQARCGCRSRLCLIAVDEVEQQAR